jgi:hypothetical protein
MDVVLPVEATLRSRPAHSSRTGTVVEVAACTPLYMSCSARSIFITVPTCAFKCLGFRCAGYVMTCAYPTYTSLVFFAVLGCLLLLLCRVFRSASRMSESETTYSVEYAK